MHFFKSIPIRWLYAKNCFFEEFFSTDRYLRAFFWYFLPRIYFSFSSSVSIFSRYLFWTFFTETFFADFDGDPYFDNIIFFHIFYLRFLLENFIIAFLFTSYQTSMFWTWFSSLTIFRNLFRENCFLNIFFLTFREYIALHLFIISSLLKSSFWEHHVNKYLSYLAHL